MHAKDAWLKSLSVLNLSSSHDDRGSDWPRLLSVERAAELQFPAVDSNDPSVSELKAKQDQLILGLHQAISDGHLAAENKTELAPVEVSVRDHNGEFVRDHDGNLRTVSGMGTVEVSMLPAQAVFDWLREQGLTPSEYLAAWFGSMKVQEHSSPDRDMPDLWSEKTASVRPPKEVPRRFAERDFLEGFESVTHLLMATSGSNGRSPISRKEISAEQCAEIAARQLLDAEDWIDLTGVGIGKHGHFRIAPDGVCFIKWSDEEVATVGDSTEDQQAMLRDNKAPSLDFPCTPDTLLMFIDSLVKSETGDGTFFEVPEAFKTAVAAQRQAPDRAEAKVITQESAQPVGVELEPVQKQGEAEQPTRADAHLEPGAGQIPGKLPNVASGRLAVKAAWEIELETKRAATAPEVMKRLQSWADEGKEPEYLIRSDRIKKCVVWNAGSKEKHYDTEACGRTIERWKKSRHQPDSGDTSKTVAPLTKVPTLK